MKKPLAALLLVIALQPSVLAQQIRFDAGSDTVAETSKLKWIRGPDQTFVRDDLRAARSDFLIDGVVGDDMTLSVDLAHGRWWVTLWLEAGKEDSTTMSLAINGEARALDWHAFNPPAEPRTEIQSIYRLYHGPVDAGEDPVLIEMEGGADLVRLLGATITPDPGVGEPDFHSRIRAAGSYGPHLELPRLMEGEAPELASLVDGLRKVVAEDPNDAFATYWLEQVNILRRAEQNIRLMGWEWATDSTGLGIFDRFHQAVMQLDGLLGRPDVESYPLYERALFQRGRLHYWLYRERGGENTRQQAEIDLRTLFERHPDDTLLAMYNGELIDTPDPCDRLETGRGAPEWSVLQLEALCRLRSEIHWWVGERQSETGEFGGKIGDDVELFRWWPPVVLSGDTTALRGWKRLADGVMVTRKVHEGYSRFPIDVEHASEFIADTAPEMVFYSDDPEYVDRLRFSADYFANLWTGLTPAGRRFFRSAWFSSTEVDERPPRNRDLEYNTRAVKAVRYLAWKTGNPNVIRTLHEWSRAWRHAAMRTDKGKPPGIIPASIRFPDEALNGDEPTWYEANIFWDYFDWDHSNGGMMLDQLLFTYTLTGDAILLEPMFATLDLIREFESRGWPSGATPPKGSAEWAAKEVIDQPKFWNSVAQWRLFTGDRSHDDLLERFGTPYARFRISGAEARLIDGLNRLLESVRYNTPLRTTEVLHTDRVRTPGAMHLKAMLTGDGTNEGSSPYYAASWENTGEGFTALITDSGFERLEAVVFSHGEDSGGSRDSLTLRVWKLEPGPYRLTITGAEPSSVNIVERGQRISIPARSNTLTTIRLESK